MRHQLVIRCALAMAVMCSSWIGGGTSAVAQDELVVDADPVRDWPAGVSPLVASIDTSVDGVTLMLEPYHREVENTPPRCLVVIADGHRARSYDYEHQFEPTGCVDALAHPDGGFFVRGEVGASPEEEVVGDGFTARIDADGQLVWVVEDSELVEPPPHSGAEGEFLGQYAGALEGLAYDEATGRLMALTLGKRILPDTERPVVQAHVVRTDTGAVEFVGQAFGPLQREPVLELVARNGEFLIHTIDEVGGEQRFYSYEPGRAMTQFEPQQADWSRRRVASPIAHRPSLGTFYLWFDEPPTEIRPRITRVEGLDSVVWTREYGADVTVEGPEDVDEIASGAHRIWVGKSLLALSVDTREYGPVVKFIDVDDGTVLAMAPWSELTDHQPIGMTRDADGKLRLLGADLGSDRIWEYALALTSKQEEEEIGDANGGGGSDDGNGCASVPTGPPAPLMAILAVLWWCRPARIAKCRGGA